MHTLWSQKEDSLKEKITSYRETRLLEMDYNHANFFDSLSENNCRSFLDCVIMMFLEQQCIGGEGMDKELFEIVKNQDGKKNIIAINPIARKTIIKYHGKSLVKPLDIKAQLIFKSPKALNDVKGKIAQLYILTRMELNVL